MEEIIIIDETPSFREGLKRILELKFGILFNIIETDSKRLNKFKKKTIPKLVIMENTTNQLTLDYIKTWRENGTKIVFLSIESELSQVKWDLYDGFLLKNMPTSQSLSVLEDIMEYDMNYVHPNIGSFLLKSFQKDS